MPLQATSGAASYDAFGGGVAAVPNYIEDVFSTYLYTGNGSTQTITNGIDLATNGGLVWIKSRSNITNNMVCDTARGVNKQLYTNLTNNEGGNTARLTSFTSSGFGLSYNAGDTICNESNYTYASWTFRKQPKFFDVVTYTGDGTSGKTISHSLGSAPGCIIVKRTDAAENWVVYHKYMFDSAGTYGSQGYINLNLTGSSNYVGTDLWSPTATTFKAFGTSVNINTSGATYVAYLFAHNAGGFGLTGTDNVISCGSLVSTGGVVNVNLGYETQWLLIKNASNIDSWYMYDTMRGMSMTDDYFLKANSSNAESNFGASYVKPTATGFSFDSSAFGASGETYIYIAIRRGPMKVPTSGTSVFTPAIGTTDYTGPQFDATFPRVDLIWEFFTTGGGVASVDRLRGDTQRLKTNSTAAEVSSEIPLDMMYGAGDGASVYDRAWMFGRAPSFFDEVCYTGTGATPNVLTHNLGVVPELIICKRRNNVGDWIVYSATLGNASALYLHLAIAAQSTATAWNSTDPTSTTFTLGNNSQINTSGATGVAYLFATCAGVSKVGSYTGTGTTKQVDCGFTGGARFVLIKRTDSTGDWYVWDSARGIVAGNDPYLLLNSTAAEVTSTDYVDTYSAGFEISSTAPAAINASGGTFIFLAIA